MDTLTASTGALASKTLGDAIYTEDRERQLADLGATATRSRARSGSRSGAPSRRHRRSTRSRRRTGSTRRTACSTRRRRSPSVPSAADDEELKKINHIVVIYEENHSFDNLYGGWEGVNGLANADAAHTTQVNEAGNAYACLKQDDVNLQARRAAGDLLGRDAGHAGGRSEPLHEHAVHDRRLHRPDGHDVPAEPAASGSPPNGSLKGTGLARRLHA